MATLDDKLMGEKTHYYCSSSEDEDDGGLTLTKGEPEAKAKGPWTGSSTNTGPKGVIKDWQRFKQLEAENAAEKERERLALFKKLSLTCSSTLDDEKQKELEEDETFLADDAFLQQYVQQRMAEMISRANTQPHFGKLVHVSDSGQLLSEIENVDKGVTVVVHVYEDSVEGCGAMNGCLVCLSEERPRVKFCKVSSRVAGMSERFQLNGVPALLVYKGGQLVGNFVRLTDEFGEDFFASDVESFLVQHGMLPDQSCVPRIISSSTDAQ